MRNLEGAMSTPRGNTSFGGMAGRIALAILAGGVLLLALSVLLQAGKQHRRFGQMHQTQLRQTAQQAALIVRSRLGNAEVLLRATMDRTARDRDGSWNTLRSSLQQDGGFFGTVSILPAASGDAFVPGPRSFKLSARDVQALEARRRRLVEPKSAVCA